MRHFIDRLDRDREAWLALGGRPPWLIRCGFAVAWIYRVLWPEENT